MYSKATIVREDGGTNADGSVSFDYCQYCYKDGKFLPGLHDGRDDRSLLAVLSIR